MHRTGTPKGHAVSMIITHDGRVMSADKGTYHLLALPIRKVTPKDPARPQSACHDGGLTRGAPLGLLGLCPADINHGTCKSASCVDDHDMVILIEEMGGT